MEVRLAAVGFVVVGGTEGGVWGKCWYLDPLCEWQVTAKHWRERRVECVELPEVVACLSTQE